MDLTLLFKPRESKVIPGLYYRTLTMGQSIEFGKYCSEKTDDDTEIYPSVWLAQNVFCDAEGNQAENINSVEDIPRDIVIRTEEIIKDIWGVDEAEKKE